MLKADLLPVEWTAFMLLFPRWWEMSQFRDRGLPGTLRIAIIRRVREFGIPSDADPLRQAAFAAIYEKRHSMPDEQGASLVEFEAEGPSECAESVLRDPGEDG